MSNNVSGINLIKDLGEFAHKIGGELGKKVPKEAISNIASIEKEKDLTIINIQGGVELNKSLADIGKLVDRTC